MEKTRTELVMQAIGWQGGTVHELCKELGLEVSKFLTHRPEYTCIGSSYYTGLYIDTNSIDHRKSKLIPMFRGNYDYWVGAAKCMQLHNESTSMK